MDLTPDEEHAGDSEGTNTKYVSTLLRGLSILDLFTYEQPTVAVVEMAKRLGTHKSNASRMATTLAHAGFLRRTGTPGVYQLGGRIAALGDLARSSSNVVDIVNPHLIKLAEATGETAHLAQLSERNAVTLAIAEGWHTIRMHSRVGKSRPAYLSSMGKAILAGMEASEIRSLYRGHQFQRSTAKTVGNVSELLRDLEQLRKRGYGFDDEELETGLRCVSAPIVDSTETVVAGISISGPYQRITLSNLGEIAEHVKWHAARASLELGASTGVPPGWSPLAQEPEALIFVSGLSHS